MIPNGADKGRGGPDPFRHVYVLYVGRRPPASATPSYDAIVGALRGTGEAPQYLEVHGLMNGLRDKASALELDKPRQGPDKWQQRIRHARLRRTQLEMLRHPSASREAELGRHLDELLGQTRPEHMDCVRAVEAAGEALPALASLEGFFTRMDKLRSLPLAGAHFVAHLTNRPYGSLEIACGALVLFPRFQEAMRKSVPELDFEPLVDASWSRTQGRLTRWATQSFPAIAATPAQVVEDLRPTQQRLGDFAKRLTGVILKAREKLAEDAAGPA